MHQILFDAESFGGNAVPPQSGTWRFGKRPAYSAFAHFYRKNIQTTVKNGSERKIDSP
jgi:hypothetical protein